ncbi:MAG: hypothetical protein KC996_05320 [Phycisphaerales bacterium]|nr:hypothetical protein [Phycisphaerales bacterium]
MNRARSCSLLSLASVLVSTTALAQHAHDNSCGVNGENAIAETLQVMRPLDQAAGRLSDPSARGASLEDGSVIDILVLYTPAARTGAGGVAEIESAIEFGWGPLDQAALQSEIPINFRIVGKVEISYTESGSMSTDLARLRIPDDGVMDEAHDLRDLYMADIVMLVVNSGDVCGIANIGVGPGNTSTPENAFGVVGRACMPVPTMAFAHEVGHIMGLMHGWDESPCDNGGSTYGKGYVEPTDAFMTMMGTGAATREARFSNPDVLRFGVLPTGVPIGDPQEANAAAAMIGAAPVIAKYRNRDLNANGILDEDEITAGTLADCNGNNYPDIGEQDFNRNGIPDECDIAMGTSLDADLDGVPDELELPHIMVNQNAIGNQTGVDWAHAIHDLQDALALARASGDIEEIWVAVGTYLTGTDGQRSRQFNLIAGVNIRGGFLGSESSPDERMPDVYTTLSGDQLQNDGELVGDVKADNSLHVLMVNRQYGPILLDRLYVQSGYADSNLNCGGFMDHGGGIFAFNGDVEIRECEFRYNAALIGGGMVISNGTVSRVHDNFIHSNTALEALAYSSLGTSPFRGYAGGVQLNSNLSGEDFQFVNNRVQFNEDYQFVSGVYIAGGAPVFANNIITNNTSYGTYGASGLYLNLVDDVEISNCVIAYNTGPVAFSNYNSGLQGGRSDKITVSNSIIWKNSIGNPGLYGDEDNQFFIAGDTIHEVKNSIIMGWTGTLNGTGTGADPLFTDAANFDYTLAAGSPAIDMGDNNALPADFMDLDNDGDTLEPLPIDLAGNTRQTDDPDTADTGNGTAPIVDAGVYEFQPVVVECPADFTGDGLLDIFDVFAFLNAFNTMDPAADFTGDGLFDIFDVFAFLNEFNAGCP